MDSVVQFEMPHDDSVRASRFYTEGNRVSMRQLLPGA